MTRKEIVVASGRGSPREELKRIEAEEARQRREELDRLALKRKVVLGPDGKVASDYLAGDDFLTEFFEILAQGNVTRRGWVTAEERKRFSEATGFDGKLYRAFFGSYTEADVDEFCSRYGFNDRKSYGRFMSLARSEELPKESEMSLHRVFFVFMYKPLVDGLSRFRDRDKALENFSNITSLFPADARAGLFHVLSEHPKALDRLLRIHHLDQDGLKDFFTRFTKNPACFDGIVRR
jgi:hypothetical protein